MNKVFLTGADGMLGSSICRELLKQNYKVKAFCLNNALQKNLSGLDIEICYGNILNRETVLNEMKGCDYVIHVAASTSLWPRRNEIVRRINIDGTKNVVLAAQQHQIKRMVHIGTASSFQEGSLSKPGNENAPYTSMVHGNDYMDSKYEAQQYLIQEFKNSRFPVVIINPTYMIGPFDSGPSSGKMIIGIYKNTIPGYSKGGKNFVCSQDVAVAIVNALGMGRLGECYIAGNQNLSYKDFFEKATQVMNRQFSFKAIPSWLVLLVGFFNSVFARLFRKPPQLSYGIAQLSLIEQYYDCTKARQELQMPQTPIEQGIKQCLDWFEENGYLK